MSFGTIAAFVIYIVAMLAIGVICYRRNRNLNDFKWVSMTVRLRRRVGLFLGDEDGQRFSRRDGVGLSWRYRGAARLRG